MPAAIACASRRVVRPSTSGPINAGSLRNRISGNSTSGSTRLSTTWLHTSTVPSGRPPKHTAAAGTKQLNRRPTGEGGQPRIAAVQVAGQGGVQQQVVRHHDGPDDAQVLRTELGLAPTPATRAVVEMLLGRPLDPSTGGRQHRG